MNDEFREQLDDDDQLLFSDSESLAIVRGMHVYYVYALV